MTGPSAPAGAPLLRRRFGRGLRRSLIVLLLAVLAALLCGSLYQEIAGLAAAAEFPPPGRMVGVGGHRLHLTRLGRGAPAVVFDSPLGASHLAWSRVQPAVAGFSEACAYDRAGYGWSEPGPGPRTSSQAVAELHALLHNAGIAPPYILVGNSIGGLNVRLFAFRYPKEVAGLVLVDPAHEDQFSRLPPSARIDPAFVRLLRRFRLGARYGLLRLLDMPLGEASAPQLPEHLRPMARAAGFSRAWIDALYRETVATEASFAEVRAARLALPGQPLGAIPLVVLTRGQAEDDTAEGREVWRQWRELHRELALESRRGRQEIVAGSGHFIQADRPGAVVAAIRRLWEMNAADRRGAGAGQARSYPHHPLM